MKDAHTITGSPRSISRRTLAKGALGAAGISALTAATTRASGDHAGFYVNLNQDKGEVVVYTWYQPWIDAVIPMFEEATGITVNQLATYSGNDEWWARLNAGESWDFFMPTSNWAERAIKADLLMPLDLEQIPNTANLMEEFQTIESLQKDGNTYAQAFARVLYCLTYNTTTFTEAPTSWEVTWDEQYKGKITMHDDALARVGTTAMYLGQDPLNPSDFDAIRESLMAQHELVGKYWEDYQNGMEMFINEEALLGQFTDGRTRMGAGLGGKMAFTIPEEGCLMEMDTFAIPKNAQNPENGHAFLNFLQQADINAIELTDMGYDTLNKAAHDTLDPTVEEGFAVPEGSTTVLVRDLDPQVRTQVDELWTEIKLG